MRFLLLFIAAVIAVFAGIAAMKLSTPEPTPNVAAANTAAEAPNPNVSTVDILVAREPIVAGTVITAAMIDKQPWPQPLVLASFIVSNNTNANVVGKVARSDFQAREPLVSSKLASMNDTGFLAALLPAGTRAITVSTDTVTGVAGFVFPGDRVDLVFTHNVPEDLKASSGDGQKSAASGKPGYAEVLAANVPVLAINLREPPKEENSTTPAAANAAATVVPSSMTLQVSDVQAEKIRLAEKVGTISIALRSINDRNNSTKPAPADLMSLTQVSSEEAVMPAVAIDDTVRVIRNGDNSR